MRMPDLLASKRGRMAAFFGLYLTEGIPLGFTATAIATQMRRQGVGVAEVGAFVASLYLPWAWKWAVGPVVDVFSSERLGRRRMWIVGAQIFMVLSLLAAVPVDFVAELKLFTALILIHNIFAATQDVAIDALAVQVLPEEERGLANGLMFGAAYLGQAIGGSGVLFLTPVVGFRTTFFLVAGALLAVTLFVALPLREPRQPRAGEAILARSGRRTGATLSNIGGRLDRAGRQMWAFVVEAARAFTGTPAARVGVLFAVLPAGAYALGLALQSNLAVELGMTDAQIGTLNLWSTVIAALGCVAGGWLSDRIGRRRSLAFYLFCTALPTVYLAWEMQRHGWILPVDPTTPDRPVAPANLIQAFWIAALVYSAFQGLMYGSRMALFMDITTPAVAATQFTAYMALSNLVIAYSAAWQGRAVEIWRWGYPKTLIVDAIFGVVSIALLPLMRPPARRRESA